MWVKWRWREVKKHAVFWKNERKARERGKLQIFIKSIKKCRIDVFSDARVPSIFKNVNTHCPVACFGQELPPRHLHCM